MGIKVKTNKNNFDRLKETSKQIQGRAVIVGVYGEQAWLAGIHEYGCRIKVTPKMRAFLHSKGLHLKESTQEIVIPERSFLRSGFDSCHDKVIKISDKAIVNVLGGAMSVEEFCDMVGLQLATKIKKYAVDLKSPANHPLTTENKGSTNPLVDTGDMIGSITYKVE